MRLAALAPSEQAAQPFTEAGENADAAAAIVAAGAPAAAVTQPAAVAAVIAAARVSAHIAMATGMDVALAVGAAVIVTAADAVDEPAAGTRVFRALVCTAAASAAPNDAAAA